MKFIAYYRVSTRQQGASGLGLEAQKAAVEAYVKAHGGEILRSFTEVESGKRADRPKLRDALAFTKRAGGTLLVAALSRLARNVAFLSRLMESHAEFLAVDNPAANRLTIHILAAVAEEEARQISKRTKAALAAYRARGGKLGASRPECRNLTKEARLRGARNSAQVLRAARVAAYADLLPAIRAQRAAGASLRAIAAGLNDAGEPARRGGRWSAAQVLRVLRQPA